MAILGPPEPLQRAGKMPDACTALAEPNAVMPAKRYRREHGFRA